MTLRAAPDGLGSLKLTQTEGIGITATNLGINTNMLGRWKREHELGTAQVRPVFTGRGNTALTEHEKENLQLRRELDIARLLDPKMHLRAGSQERDILKKALAFFLLTRQHLAGCSRFAKETR